MVHGRHPMRTYGREDTDKVRNEIKAALARQGIDLDGQTLVIFQLLLDLGRDKATEIGPFRGGVTWVPDTIWLTGPLGFTMMQHLDPRLLSSKAPGGYY